MTDSTVVDELKRLSRRIEDIAKTQDRLSNDREILEDVLSRMSAIEMALSLQRTTQTENAKDIKADISDIKEAVEAKVSEVTETMDNNTVIVKSPTEGVIQKIINKVSGK